jgi:ribosomal protein S14
MLVPRKNSRMISAPFAIMQYLIIDKRKRRASAQRMENSAAVTGQIDAIITKMRLCETESAEIQAPK